MDADPYTLWKVVKEIDAGLWPPQKFSIIDENEKAKREFL